MPWQRKSTLGGQRLTPDQARKKAERYCAYQDRCHQEVRRKLFGFGLYGGDVDQVMAQLIEDRFVDEERFARSYARGKFRMKKWGRVRITRELKSRQISPYCIKAGLSEIEEPEYLETLISLLQKRLDAQKPDLHPYARRQNLIDYGLRKGYEMNLVLEHARQLAP